MCFHDLPYLDVEGDRFVNKGNWDSIHIVEVHENEAKTSATYKLTTTIILTMQVDKAEVGQTNWSGTLTRQVSSSIINCAAIFLCIYSCYLVVIALVGDHFCIKRNQDSLCQYGSID